MWDRLPGAGAWHTPENLLPQKHLLFKHCVCALHTNSKTGLQLAEAGPHTSPAPTELNAEEQVAFHCRQTGWGEHTQPTQCNNLQNSESLYNGVLAYCVTLNRKGL